MPRLSVISVCCNVLSSEITTRMTNIDTVVGRREKKLCLSMSKEEKESRMLYCSDTHRINNQGRRK